MRKLHCAYVHEAFEKLVTKSELFIYSCITVCVRVQGRNKAAIMALMAFDNTLDILPMPAVVCAALVAVKPRKPFGVPYVSLCCFNKKNTDKRP